MHSILQKKDKLQKVITYIIHLRHRSWYVKNLRYVNDLVDESGLLVSPTELINKFNLKGTFLQAFGIMCAIPDSWKSAIRDFGKQLPAIKSQNMEELFKAKRRPVSLMIPCVNQLPHSQLRCSVNGINIFRLQ